MLTFIRLRKVCIMFGITESVISKCQIIPQILICSNHRYSVGTTMVALIPLMQFRIWLMRQELLALFIIFEQCLLECLNHGDDAMALAVLRKEVSALKLGKDEVLNLAKSSFSFKDMEFGNRWWYCLWIAKEVVRVGKIASLWIMLPERRLEHLVETAVRSILIHVCTKIRRCSSTLWVSLLL